MLRFIGKRLRKNLMAATVVTLCGTGFAITSYAQYGSLAEAELATSIQKIVMNNGPGAGGTEGSLSGIRFFRPAAIRDYYDGRQNMPVWTSRRGLAEVREILEVFEDSWRHGLNPGNYHVSQIKEMLADPGTDKARLDLVVTDAVMRYGHDMTGMRFDPKLIRQKSEYWRMPLAASEIMRDVAEDPNPSRALADLSPDTSLYRALQGELERLSREDINLRDFTPLKFGGSNHFAPGSRHKDVAALRARLDVAYRDGQGGKVDYYDDETAAAVMKFQREHGLEPDGIIGPQTLAILNRTNRDRMEQVIANLERLRWLEQDKPEKYVIVNIPQQLLWAVEDGRVAHEMKVVVGLPHRRTQEFKTQVTGVRFNPNWTVPLNLKMNDFLPKLQEDPGYLTSKGMEVIKGVGRDAVSLDPHSIDWHSMTRSEMNKMRFVQRPGDHNALGAVRVLMPNDYDIYMHDTNHPEFFEKEQRTLSSGCVRLSEPEKLAAFILKDNEDWSPEKMDGIIRSGRMTEIMANSAFPVYIIYHTMWLDQNGRLVYGSDVYKRDRDLIKVLAGFDGFVLPGEDVREARLQDSKNTTLASSD